MSGQQSPPPTERRATPNFLQSLETSISLPEPCADPAACLEPTDVIDSAHPSIVETAGRLTQGLETPFERVVAVFNFVRDSVRYNFAPDLLSRGDWRASETLARGDGFCQQKAVLLAALARAAGIPSAIGFQHLRDYKLLDTRYEAAIPEGLIPFHGFTYLWLDGAWRIMDATLDAELCTRRGYRLVEPVPGADARLPATDRAGKPHFDILTEWGPFPNLPEPVSAHMVSLRPAWLALREVIRRTGATM